MNKFYYQFLLLFYFLLVLGMQETIAQCWNEISPFRDVADISFIHPDTGWLINKSGEIHKTADGGVSWELIHQIEGVDNPTGKWRMEFVNQSVGYLITQKTGFPYYFKTINGGEDWEQIELFIDGFGADFKNLDFVDAQIGFIAANNSVLFKTTNGGDSWTKLEQRGNHFRSLYFFDENTGYSGTDFNGTIYKTINGTDFTKIDVNTNAIENNNNALANYFFLGKRNGWITTVVDNSLHNHDHHQLVKTNNGGDSWTTLTNAAPFSIKAVFFITEAIGWVSGYDGTYKTTTGGNFWEKEEDTRMSKLELFDPNSGWAIGGGSSKLYSYQACESPACIPVIRELSDQNILPRNTSFSWDAPTQTTDGYFVYVGSFPGGSDIIDTFITTTTLQPTELLPEATSLYINIIPKNNKTGSPNGCTNFEFATVETNICNTVTVTDARSICANTCTQFQGQTYCVAGNYPITLQTALGCDSTIQLELTLMDYNILLDSATILEGDTYNWNGNSYQAPGMYYDTISRSGECVVEGLDLRLEATIPCTAVLVEEKQTVCANTCVTFQGATYCETGIYPIRFQTSSRCDSIVQLALTIMEYTDFTETASITMGDTFYWRDKEYQQAGIYADTISNSGDCLVEVLDLRVDEPVNIDDLCLAEVKRNLPNAIHPTGQVIENQVFDPLQPFTNQNCTVNSTDLKLTIMNRWGEVVFQTSKGKYEPWKGQQQNNDMLPYGTYYYVFQYGKNRKEVLTGALNLIQ